MYYGLIQPVLWAFTLSTGLFFAFRAFRLHRKGASYRTWLCAAVIAAVGACVIVPALGIVPPGNRGVVYQLNGGISPHVRGEGVTLLIPWVQHMTTISVRTQKVYSDKIYAQSRDLQEITVVASVNYHVLPSYASRLYQRVGTNYANVVIQPALFQHMKAAVGQIQAIDFASERDKLAQRVKAQLVSQLGGYGIVIEFVNIEDAIFDPAFVASVKAKIIAHQQAEQQHNLIAAAAAKKAQTIINAEATARSVLIKATAQSKANDLLARSITPVLLRWQWITTWSGVLPSTLVTGGATNLLLGIGSGSSAYPGD